MIGVLAQRWSGLELEVQVLKSGAGYYLGTFTPNQGPVSRESQEYYRTNVEAQAALDNTFTQRTNP